MSTSKRYTDEKKIEILADSKAIGQAKTVEKYGISKSTLHLWSKKKLGQKQKPKKRMQLLELPMGTSQKSDGMLALIVGKHTDVMAAYSSIFAAGNL